PRMRSCPVPMGTVPNLRDDHVVACAPIDVAEHPLADLSVGWVRDRVEQRLGRHDLARRADTALKTARVDEGLLHGMQAFVPGESLHCRDLMAVGAHR